jgi:hypothetical protein
MAGSNPLTQVNVLHFMTHKMLLWMMLPLRARVCAHHHICKLLTIRSSGLRHHVTCYLGDTIYLRLYRLKYVSQHGNIPAFICRDPLIYVRMTADTHTHTILSTDQSPSPEANSSWGCHEIPRTSWNSNSHHRLHNSAPLVPIPSQINPVHVPHRIS